MNRSARFLLAAVCVLLSATALLEAQSDFSGMQATSSLSAGVQFAGGASMTIDPPQGRKVRPVFAWRLGADATYPLTPVIISNLQFGFESRGTRLHSPSNPDSYTDTRLNYFFLNPGFRFSAFYAGFNFGFPVSAGMTNHNGTDYDVETDGLETLLEPRMGAVITLLDAEPGWLSMSIIGGFAVNDFAESVRRDESLQFVSLHMGLSWQFAIPGTSRQPADDPTADAVSAATSR